MCQCLSLRRDMRREFYLEQMIGNMQETVVCLIRIALLTDIYVYEFCGVWMDG